MPGVWTRKEGSLYKNGKKKFAVGIYYEDYTCDSGNAAELARVAAIAELGAAGFDFVHLALSPNNAATINAAVAAGIEIIPEDNGFDNGMADIIAAYPASFSILSLYDDVDKKTSGTYNHPPATVAANCSTLHNICDYQLYAAAGYPARVPDFFYQATGLDCIGMECYPITSEGTDAPQDSYWPVMAGHEGAWFGVVQTFVADTRWPTADEILDMAHQAVKLGAAGILFYSYNNDPGDRLRDNAAQWAAVCQFAADMALPAEPKTNYWVGAKLTLKEIANPKEISDPIYTKTVYLTRRPRYSQSGLDPLYWPIITNIPEVGYEAGRYLPEAISSTLTIDNRPGTFGPYRKFSDLFERFAIENAVVQIYVDTTPGNDNTFLFDSANLRYSGHVESYSGLESINLELSGVEIPDQLACMEIDSYSFSDAPSSSQGKYLPIIAGNVIVPGYRISADDDDTPYWCIAANLADDYEHDITDLPYVRDTKGSWTECNAAWADQGSASSVDGYTVLDLFDEQACAIVSANGQMPLLGIKVLLRPGASGTSNSVSDETLTATIYEYDTTTKTIGDSITSGSVKLSDYDTANQQTASTYFWATVPFSSTVMPSPETSYAVAFSVANLSVWSPSLCYDSNVTATRLHTTNDTASLDSSNFQIEADSYSFIFKWGVLSFYVPTTGRYRATISDDGTIYSYGEDTDVENFITLGMYGKDFSTSMVPLDCALNLEVAFSVDGIRDNNLGTITGTAYTPLTRPDHFIEMLDRLSQGDPWSLSGNWDFDTYSARCDEAYASSGVRTRALKGYLGGYQTIPELLEAVCRDTASRIGVTSAGKLFVWPWGPTSDVSMHIPADDIIPEAWSASDISSVVNRVSVSYGKTQIDYDPSRNLSSQQNNNYDGSLTWTCGTNTKTSVLSSASVKLYGQRPAVKLDTDMIGDELSAQTLAEYYLASFAHPEISVTFSVPFDTYGSLKMFDVITFGHPAFPLFLGTRNNDGQPVTTGENAARSNLTEGHNLARYKQYRGLIEAVKTQLPIEGAPSIRLRVKLLRNYPADPT